MRSLLLLALVTLSIPATGGPSSIAAAQYPVTAVPPKPVEIGAPVAPVLHKFTPPAAPYATPRIDRSDVAPSTLSLVAWGVGGMVAGLAAGAYAADALACSSGCVGEDPGLREATIGAAVGMTLSTPIAVHLGNGRRGNFAASVGASILISGIWMIGSALDIDGPLLPIFLIGPPVAQIGSSVWIERRAVETARRWARGEVF